MVNSNFTIIKDKYKYNQNKQCKESTIVTARYLRRGTKWHVLGPLNQKTVNKYVNK